MSKTKFKCPYTYPHKSRKAMVDYLCSIGGYSRFHDGAWPIEFNVAIYDADFDFDHLWKTYGPDSGEGWVSKFENPEEAAAYYRLAQRLHKEHEEHIWLWGQEDACRSISDCDTYRTLWDGTNLEVDLQLRGRGGKHLVISSFEGTKLEGVREDDLEAMLATEDENNYGFCWSFEKVKLFYKYVRQCEVDFTTEKASKEAEYQGAFCFFINIVESEWEAERQRIADHNDVVAAGMTLKEVVDSFESQEALNEAFATLCQAAGIRPEDLIY